MRFLAETGPDRLAHQDPSATKHFRLRDERFETLGHLFDRSGHMWIAAEVAAADYALWRRCEDVWPLVTMIHVAAGYFVVRHDPLCAALKLPGWRPVTFEEFVAAHEAQRKMVLRGILARIFTGRRAQNRRARSRKGG
jgi:hypothetical protein